MASSSIGIGNRNSPGRTAAYTKFDHYCARAHGLLSSCGPAICEENTVNYRPKLKGIQVPLQKLLLDPNNPRFLEDHTTRVDEKDFADSGVQGETADRMRKEAFNL